MLNTLLPSSSLIPFKVRGLTNAQQIWKNDAIARELDLSVHHFCLPHEGDPKSSYTTDEKIVFAERYGGQRIVNNGGGVRCGVDGLIQIKGVGRNCLAGRNSNFWYSHGGATLEEAIRETIWGEVCAIALPFGSVRVYGIVCTGTETYFQNPNGSHEKVPRALILREAVLRPAHYMRAIYYEPSDDMLVHHCSDVERTKRAINEIDIGLSQILGRELAIRPDLEVINAGILELARRFAAQMAAAHAKRIMHGTVNCSNIALDGRYLDYGTITTISDYGRIIVAGNNPDLWRTHTKLHPTFNNLLYYLQKYLPPNVSRGVLQTKTLIEAYSSYHTHRLHIEFIKLTGVPEWRFSAFDSSILNNMYRCLMKIVERGNKEPFKLNTMPEKMGAFHLNSILRAACLCNNPEQISDTIKPLLGDAQLCDLFTTCYYEFQQSYLAMFAAEYRPFAKLFVALNAHRLNTEFPELYRPNLVRSISNFINQREKLDQMAAFISEFIAKANALLSDPKEEGIDLQWYCGKRIFATETAISSMQNSHIRPKHVIEILNDKHFTTEQKRMLFELCK